MNEIFKITKKEFDRQKSSLNLIASENYPSPRVLDLLGSVWNNKYAEGYPGKRYYAGNKYSDELELFVKSKALEVFDKTGEYDVNVQVLSGSPANSMVYLSVLEPGDTVLSLDLASGGHLSHLHSTSSYLKFYKQQNYLLRVGENGFELDLDDYSKKLETIKPRLVVLGFSSYPQSYEFKQLCEMAHSHGALVLADISHISGLVAAGEHSTPFLHNGSGADFVTTTTHKTLRGPRSALLFCKKEYINSINKTIFPGTSGGPHLNQVAAVGQALLEVLGEETYPDKSPFDQYIKEVITNTKALENALIMGGLEVTSKTQNHLVLLKLPKNIDSLEMQNKLEDFGIITNRNSIPNDNKTSWVPGGLRLGMAALTSRGITEELSTRFGSLVAGIIKNEVSKADARSIVSKMLSNLSWWY